MEDKKYIHNPICYINSFCCTISKITKTKNKKFLLKTVTSLKFNINANIYEKSQQQSPNFVRSNQESPDANSLVISTNDATKGKNDKSSKIEKIWTG